MSREAYRKKDLKKFSVINKLISRGAVGSSSEEYARKGCGGADAKNTNVNDYVATDVVGISVNGRRKDAIAPDVTLIGYAAYKRVSFVTDCYTAACRSYNTGERKLRLLLGDLDYFPVNDEEQSRTIWMPAGFPTLTKPKGFITFGFGHTLYDKQLENHYMLINRDEAYLILQRDEDTNCLYFSSDYELCELEEQKRSYDLAEITAKEYYSIKEMNER